MVYLNLLCIRAWDWQEKINLAIMDRTPTDEEQNQIIKEYWARYEKGRFEDLDEFLEYLKDTSKNDEPYRKGIWIEKIGLLANPDRLLSLLK